MQSCFFCMFIVKRLQYIQNSMYTKNIFFLFKRCTKRVSALNIDNIQCASGHNAGLLEAILSGVCIFKMTCFQSPCSLTMTKNTNN